MKGNATVKRIIGVIIMLLLFPLMSVAIRTDQGDTFWQAFKLGLMYDGFIIAFFAFVLLMTWLFGGFE